MGWIVTRRGWEADPVLCNDISAASCGQAAGLNHYAAQQQRHPGASGNGFPVSTVLYRSTERGRDQVVKERPVIHRGTLR